MIGGEWKGTKSGKRSRRKGGRSEALQHPLPRQMKGRQEAERDGTRQLTVVHRVCSYQPREQPRRSAIDPTCITREHGTPSRVRDPWLQAALNCAAQEETRRTESGAN